MIVARAIGLSRAEIFESPVPGSGRPALESQPAWPVGIDEIAWLHRGALGVPLLPVERPPVRLGPTLRTHPSAFVLQA